MTTEALFVSAPPLHSLGCTTSFISANSSGHVPRRLRQRRVARVRACIQEEEASGDTGDVSGVYDVYDVSATNEANEAIGVSSAPCVAEAKAALYGEIGVLDRGFSATQAQHSRVLSLIGALEGAGECDAPLSDALLLGRWELLYTNALDIISLSLLSPIASITSVYQDIYEDLRVVNVVNLQSSLSPVLNLLPIPAATLSSLDTRVEICGQGTPRNDNRNTNMLDLEITGQKITQVRVPLLGTKIPEAINSFSVGVPPWNRLLGDTARNLACLETTFLDEDVRVARAGKTPLVANDGVFLLRRVADEIPE